MPDGTSQPVDEWHASRDPSIVTRSRLITLVLAVLILNGLIGGWYVWEYEFHPRYHAIRDGMTEPQVDMIVGAGYDSYPSPNGSPNGGWTNYYFSSEGTIIVSFDATGRAVNKKLQRD